MILRCFLSFIIAYITSPIIALSSELLLLISQLINQSIYQFIYLSTKRPLSAISRTPLDIFKPKNQAVEKTFYSVINAAYRNPRKVYKYYYKELNYNTINLQKYLNKYKPYRNEKPSDKLEGS